MTLSDVAIIASCPTALKQLHLINVKSHQDKKRPGIPKKYPCQLPFSAQLNYLADKLVTRYLTTYRWGEWVPNQLSTLSNFSGGNSHLW
jgi:hypothetical protein